jgi:hypothetical protein
VADAVNPDAWKAFWPDLADLFMARGYRVLKIDEVERYFAQTMPGAGPAELRELPPMELARKVKADGIVYAQVTRCGSAYLIAKSDFRIEADFELLDGKTGEILWQGQGIGINQSQVEGSGLGAAIGAVLVAASAAAPDVPGCWRRCVGSVVGGLPWAGRDPEAPGATAAVPEAAAPSIKESGRTYIVDSAGWILGVAGGLVLLSNTPGPIKEVDGGFNHNGTTFAQMDGLWLSVAQGKSWSMGFDPAPRGWEGDLLAEFLRAIQDKAGLTLKEWLRSRLVRFPSPKIAKLIE